MNRVGYSHLTALVFETDPAQQQRVGLVLDEFGMTARYAGSPAAMVAGVRAAQVDLLLVDLAQSSDGGRKLVEMVREAGYTGPVVAMGADLAGSTGYMDVMARFDACMAKPLSASSMMRTLRQVFQVGS